MKDYTIYNFDAIIGAKVSLNHRNGLVYEGTLVFANKRSIGIKASGTGVFRHLAKEDILTLFAEISTEHMTVGQLIEYMRRNGQLDGDEVLLRFRVAEIKGTINCSDWGWKHE